MIAQQVRQRIDRLRGIQQHRPPGPSFFRSLTSYAQRSFEEEQPTLELLVELKESFGDVAFWWIGPVPAYMISDPELIDELYIQHRDKILKDAGTRNLRDLLGRGLLTQENPEWRPQRKRIAPALTRRHVASYADTMVRYATEMAETIAPNSAVDMHELMTHLTLRIVSKALFDTEVASEIDVIGQALDISMDYFQRAEMTLWRFVPRDLPVFPMRREFEQALERLDQVLYRMIDQRRQVSSQGDDLLSRLMEGYRDNDEPIDRELLRDELVTMLMAGHETTALALSYAFYALGYNSDVYQQLRQEVDEVLGDRPATLEDLANLPYCKAVAQETLRLYSPAWMIGRELTEDIELGGWKIPAGSQVFSSQYVVHRDARWFEEPERFKPERWLDGLERSLPRFAYFPFGGGERVCVGNHFAMMEISLVLATLTQSLRFDPQPGFKLQFEPSITLRPRAGVPMNARRR